MKFPKQTCLENGAMNRIQNNSLNFRSNRYHQYINTEDHDNLHSFCHQEIKHINYINRNCAEVFSSRYSPQFFS
jgi:galactose mutarotase-like enzyme